MPHDDITEELLRGMPAFYLIDHDSNLNNLFKAIAGRLSFFDETIEEATHALTVQQATAQSWTIEPRTEELIRSGDRIYRDEIEVRGDLVIRGEVYCTSLTTAGAGTLTIEDDGELVEDANLSEFITRLEKLGELVDTPPHDGETLAHYRARLLAAFLVLTCEGTLEDVSVGVSEILDIDGEFVDLQDRIGTGTVGVGVPVDAVEDSTLSGSELAAVIERLIAASYRLEVTTVGSFEYITPSQYDIGDHDSTKGYDGLDTDGNPKDTGGEYAGVIE